MSHVPESGGQSSSSLASNFTGRRYAKLVLVLGALTALGPLATDTYLSALPELAADLSADDSQAQMTITGLLIGLGLGQLVIGPLSDAVGRRGPLWWGLAGHAATSVLCAFAPSITVLVIGRIAQGAAGAAVAVVAMATVRDLFVGYRAAALLSRLTLVFGIAPVVAPSLGGALLALTSWRGIFVALAVAAAGLLAMVALTLPETLLPAARQGGPVRASIRAYRLLFTDPLFMVMVMVASLMFAALFTYISGAPFLLQGRFGLTPQQFGLAFGANAAALIVMAQLTPLLLRWFSPVLVLGGALVLGVLASAALLVTALTGFGGLAGFLAPLWLVMAAVALSFPTAPAIALYRHGDAAGAAAALLGACEAFLAGIVAPLVGVLADGTAVPLAGILLSVTGLALVFLFAARRQLSAISFVERS